MSRTVLTLYKIILTWHTLVVQESFWRNRDLVIAFYGKKGAPQAGLSVEQGMEACQVIGNITAWMGHVASVKVKAISLVEADEMVRGMKRLEKESLRKARLELCQRLSALQLGHNTTLSVSAKPFVPLATSSQMGINGNGLMEAVFMGPFLICLYLRFPLRLANSVEQGSLINPRYPLLRKMRRTTTDGTTTDSSVIPAKKGSCTREAKEANEGKERIPERNW